MLDAPLPHNLVTGLTVTIGLITAIENLFLIGLVISSPQLRTRKNYVITSLAIVDLLSGISNTLWLFIQDFRQKVLDIELCQIVYAIWCFPLFNSVLHLILLTLDRYIAVVYSLQYHSLMTTPRLFICICLCWL